MIKHRYPILVLAAATVALVSMPALAAPVHAAVKQANEAKPAEAPKPAEKAVAYKDLESQIGAELAIETTFNTVRRGTLVKYTNPGLTIQLGSEAGSIELEVPAETIRRVSIVTPAPQAATRPQENSSAKKN
jgi:hypothetical protein